MTPLTAEEITALRRDIAESALLYEGDACAYNDGAEPSPPAAMWLCKTALRLLDEVERRRKEEASPWVLRSFEASLREAATDENSDVLGAMDGEVLCLLDELARSRALLKRIEWSGAPSNRVCPECENVDEHRSDCELAALIGGAK